MPWKLIPPHTRADGKVIKAYYIRGTYLSIRLDDSTGTCEASAAKRILTTWRKQAERGEFRRQQPKPERAAPSFANAATAYMRAGGDGQYMEPILKAWPNKMLADIDQIAIDTVAAELYPLATPQTRNRQVYTPISAVLKHVGIEKKVKRPKGWRGKKSKSWLEPEQAWRVFEAADKIDLEFGLLLRHLLYTGMRIEEALTRELRDIQLDRAYCYLPDSKNGEPRGCHLPPYLVDAYLAQPQRMVTPVIRDEHGHYLSGKPLEDAGVPFLERNPKAKLFRFHKGGALYGMLKATWRAVRLTWPRREGGFHIFCHSYGSWMHRWGKLDRHGLTRTGRWKDPDSADGYVHTQQSEEARRADLMPTPNSGQVVEIKREVG